MNVFFEILSLTVVGLFVIWYLYYVGKLIVKLFSRSVHNDNINHKT